MRSDYFTSEFKRLAKRYRSLAEDYERFLESLMSNPLQGVEIAPNVRKVRMAIGSKGRGKSGGARVITLNALVTEQDGTVYLLLVYDKADASNMKMNVVREIIKEMGLWRLSARTSSVNGFSICGLSHSERPSITMQKAVFYTLKDGLLQCAGCQTVTQAVVK